MDKANSTIKMEDIIKDTGKTTKWTAMVNSIMKEENLPTKATGAKISSMASEKSITTTQSPLSDHSTTPTLTTLKTTGNTMKACSPKTANKVEEK